MNIICDNIRHYMIKMTNYLFNYQIGKYILYFLIVATIIVFIHYLYGNNKYDYNKISTIIKSL